jgi:hypothetical protein
MTSNLKLVDQRGKTLAAFGNASWSTKKLGTLSIRGKPPLHVLDIRGGGKRRIQGRLLLRPFDESKLFGCISIYSLLSSCMYLMESSPPLSFLPRSVLVTFHDHADDVRIELRYYLSIYIID